MDKNTIIGFILIGIVLFAFSWLNRPTQEQIEAQRHYRDSLMLVQQQIEQELRENAVASPADELASLPDSVREERLRNDFGSFGSAMTGKEELVTLENDLIELKLNSKGGRIAYVRLKEYSAYDGSPLVLFDDKESIMDFTLVTAANRVVNTSDLFFTPIKEGDNTVVMRLDAGNGTSLDFIYTLKPDDYMVDFSILGNGLNGILSPSTETLSMTWAQDIRQQEKGRKFEDRYVGLHYKVFDDSPDYLSESSNDSESLKGKAHWIGFKDMFFSSVLMSPEKGMDDVSLDSHVYKSGIYMKHFTAKASVPFDLKGNEATNLRFFFGPNKFALLNDYNKGDVIGEKPHLEKLVPLGWGIFRWINQYFIIPLFNLLGGAIANYGWIIFLMTIIVKIILLPLTYKSYMSSAKMRVLRPQVEEINAKYPEKEQAMDRQRAVMELYSSAGASPMSGCIPMLLQMPILIALFMFFPSAIELRHESFLWASDLSTYDAIVTWNAQIPLVSTFFGNHISLFCLLMTVTNIAYTKFNMDMTNTGQQQMPGMKMMMYLMPVMFMFIFNSYASGLTYYYFLSMLISIAQTVLFRYTVNEEKLLAKLEENKKRPMKKSSFLKRLEEAQKMQEENLRKQKEARQIQEEKLRKQKETREKARKRSR